ncbi:MAG TPA: hypothetical protein VMF69_17295, partial [Gemmataceae bacterium]|nr:hypothetical protein [Gemmataceae bacterium]
MSEVVFNPMEGIVAESNGGGLPAGAYQGEFVGAEHLPALEPDPMTGKSERQYAKVVFKWLISHGEHQGK